MKRFISALFLCTIALFASATFAQTNDGTRIGTPIVNEPIIGSTSVPTGPVTDEAPVTCGRPPGDRRPCPRPLFEDAPSQTSNSAGVAVFDFAKKRIYECWSTQYDGCRCVYGCDLTAAPDNKYASPADTNRYICKHNAKNPMIEDCAVDSENNALTGQALLNEIQAAARASYTRDWVSVTGGPVAESCGGGHGAQRCCFIIGDVGDRRFIECN